MTAPPRRAAAFYDTGRGTGGIRDWITLLHPPYTVWHLSYVVFGAAVVPHLVLWRLGGTLLAFFLAVGIGAHALDELHGRPLGTGISSRQLIIAGQRRAQESEGRLYQQIEIPHGPFRRVVELGSEVDGERASATYDDGILRIEIPLAQSDEASRRIPIEGGEGGPG